MADAILHHCEFCKKEFKGKSRNTNRFCSVPCYQQFKLSGGYKKDFYAGRVTKNCAHCKTAVTRFKSDITSDDVFCDMACHTAFRQEKAALRTAQCEHCGKVIRRRDKNPRTYCNRGCADADRRAKPKNCMNCGCLFTPVKMAHGKFISYNDGQTCSAKCISELRRKNTAAAPKKCGADHHNWQGGKSHINDLSYRGPNWNKQRKAALTRDGFKCVSCGKSDNECRLDYGKGLDVDHISPYHNFTDYRKANVLSNLQCVCAACHKKQESKRTLVQMVLPLQGGTRRRHSGILRGEKHNMAKLTVSDVIDIRKRLAEGETQRSIAMAYEIGRSNVGSIKNNRTWKNVS